ELEHPERAADIKRLVFARTPIAWDEWDAAWQKDAEGEGNPGLPGLGELLWPWPLQVIDPDGPPTLPIGAPPRREADETLPLRPRAPAPVSDGASARAPASAENNPEPFLRPTGEPSHGQETPEQGPAAPQEAGGPVPPPAQGGPLAGPGQRETQER